MQSAQAHLSICMIVHNTKLLPKHTKAVESLSTLLPVTMQTHPAAMLTGQS